MNERDKTISVKNYMRYKERNAMNQFRRMVIINIITLIVLVGGESQVITITIRLKIT